MKLSLTSRAGKKPGEVELSSGALSVADATLRYRGGLVLDPFAYRMAIESEPIQLAGWEELIPALSDLAVEGGVAFDLGVSGKASDDGLPRLTGSIALSELAVGFDQASLLGVDLAGHAVEGAAQSSDLVA